MFGIDGDNPPIKFVVLILGSVTLSIGRINNIPDFIVMDKGIECIYTISSSCLEFPIQRVVSISSRS
jgi:hypothetical protein